MAKSDLNWRTIFGCVLMTGTCSLSYAQAVRTWVSGVGDDANPCSRTAPCKTFAGAISKTAAGGEINAIDSGGFGTVTIMKSITIDGNGVHASILSSGTNGIVISAGANDVVEIRNISINGGGSGLNGIRYISGKELHVESVIIQNLVQKGIDVTTTTAGSQLYIRDTTIRNAADVTNGGGIHVHPASPGTVAATFDNVRLIHNKFGIKIEDNVKATVRNCVATHSTVGNGYAALSTNAPSEMFIENSIADANTSFAAYASGSAARVYLSNLSMFNNGLGGLDPLLGGQIISFSNNKNANVNNPGAPTSTVVQQ